MQLFYERLQQERKRLGLIQEDAARHAGVSKRTYCNWEAGDSAPSVIELSALSSVGFDVYYIINGERVEPTRLTAQQECAGYTVDILNKEEQALLDNYRNTPETGKKIVEATVLAAAQPGRKKA